MIKLNCCLPNVYCDCSGDWNSIDRFLTEKTGNTGSSIEHDFYKLEKLGVRIFVLGCDDIILANDIKYDEFNAARHDEFRNCSVAISMPDQYEETVFYLKYL